MFFINWGNEFRLSLKGQWNKKSNEVFRIFLIGYEKKKNQIWILTI